LPSFEETLKNSAATVKVLDSDLLFKRRRQKKQFFFFFFQHLFFFPALIDYMGHGGLEPISEQPCALVFIVGVTKTSLKQQELLKKSILFNRIASLTIED
jgi:hypothetical protein